MEQRYCFTQAELSKLLHDVVERFIDQREHLGNSAEHAQHQTVGAVMEALAWKRQLALQGDAVDATACRSEELRAALTGLFSVFDEGLAYADMYGHHPEITGMVLARLAKAVVPVKGLPVLQEPEASDGG